ncbi:MAG: class I SAM-dependent methyltransferase [Oscillospiraceae bacterium]|jgi:ubiquinone/menaquinone biosynthesis C-methylase UbiE|nr:class I SAM-dependent methyltransferase [Oscillospiraceae bacterium]
MGIVAYIGGQFRKPTGLGGRLSAFVMNRMNQKQYRAAEAALGLAGSDTVLDVGFGNGYLLRRLAERYGSRFYGIEISGDMLRAASERNSRAIAGGAMTLTLGDVVRLDFADGFFDKIYTVNTVYFWSDLDAGLAEIYRVLKAGGLFVNAVYTKEFLDGLRYTKRGFAKYSLEEFAAASERNGFSVEVKPITAGKAYCLICRKRDN